MKKPTKLLLGLATIWPFFYLILFFVVIFWTMVFTPGSAAEESGPPPLITLILPLHLLTMLWVIELIVFYMVNVFRNDRVQKDMKVLWAVVLFMGSMIAMPIYWYLYIWREMSAPDSPPAPHSALRGANDSGWANDAKASDREPQYVPPSQPPNWRE